MDNKQGELIEGWLKKLKSEGSSSFFSKFNKRWFVLDTKHGTFSYSNAKNKKVKLSVPLEQVVRINDFKEENSHVIGNWEYKFSVSTEDRLFVLYCKTEEEKIIWVEALQNILDKKTSSGQENKKEKKKKRKSKRKKNKENKLEIDQIFVKRGPRETMKLEPSAPLELLELDMNQQFLKMGLNGDIKKNQTIVKRTQTKLQEYSYGFNLNRIESVMKNIDNEQG